MQIHKAVIPAAGLGTRLLPATKSQPKEMLPVGRKPTIQYVVEELYAAGIKHILIITSGQKRAIEDHFDIDVVLTNRLKRGNKSLSVLDHVELDIQLFYIRQKVLAGLGDAIGLAENFVSDEPFIVALGDSIIKSEHPGSLLKRLMNTHLAHNAGATIAFREVERKNVVKYGIAVPKDEPGMEFELRDIIEKPTIKSAPSNLAVAARYVFSSDIFAYIEKTPPGAGGEIQITDSIRLMLQNGHPVWGVRLSEDEVRYDIGNFQSYFEAFFDFSLNDAEYGAAFRAYAAVKLDQKTEDGERKMENGGWRTEGGN